MENLSCSKEKYPISQDKSQQESIYELTGVCNLVALFHRNNSIKYIKKLLIYDLMRSLYARIRLLVEDLDARKDIIGDVQLDDPNSNDVSSIEESYQTPSRIHVHLSSAFVISDYVFPDETEVDIKDRIRELYNFDITDSNKQIFYVEDLPPEIKSNQSEDINEKSDSSSNANLNQNSSSNMLCNTKGNINKFFYYLCALLIAIVAFGLVFVSYDAAKFLNNDFEVWSVHNW